MKSLPRCIPSGFRSLLACGIVTVAASAQAQIIYSDNFSGGTNGASLGGQAPSTDNTGLSRTYVNYSRGNAAPAVSFSQYDTGTGNPGSSAKTSYGAGTAISLASGGSFTQPIQMTISADLQMNTIVDGGTGTPRGVALGFYSSTANFQPGNFEPNVNFTGLQMKPNGGLSLIVNGSTVGSAVAFNGTFSASTFYNLSYNVNTTTGAISNVIFNGNDLSSSFTTTAFTPAATSFAGFWGSTASNVNFTGRVDNFTVTAIPEPTSLVLLGLAGAGLLARRRRRATV